MHAISPCHQQITQQIDKLNFNSLNDKQTKQMYTHYSQCAQPVLLPLAQQGNIYAVDAMSVLTHEGQWQQKFKSMAGSEQYQQFKKCANETKTINGEVMEDLPLTEGRHKDLMKKAYIRVEQITIACQNDNECVYQELLQAHQVDPTNAVLGFYLKEAPDAQELATYKQACQNAPQYTAYNAAITECHKLLLEDIKHNASDKETQNKTFQCLKAQLQPLTEQNNLFAIDRLHNLTNDAKLQEKLAQQKDTEAFEVFLNCQNIDSQIGDKDGFGFNDFSSTFTE